MYKFLRIGALAYLAVTLIGFTHLLILASCAHNWAVTAYFNDYGEAWIEFPLFMILAFFAAVYLAFEFKDIIAELRKMKYRRK